MRYYPIAIDLRDKVILIAGGGRVAERKVFSLSAAGSIIIVVSPRVSFKLRRLAESGRIFWINRKVCKTDLAQARFVIAATDDIAVNESISKWAREKGLLVNVVDNRSLSDFISVALLRKAKSIISVYTDGRDPEFARDLKNFLKEYWGEFLSYRDRLSKN